MSKKESLRVECTSLDSHIDTVVNSFDLFNKTIKEDCMQKRSKWIRAWRFVYQNTLAWTFTAIYIPLLFCVVAFSFGMLADTVGHQMVKLWGRVMLRISGVRLVVVNGEALKERKNRVLVFNHTSTLDMFIGTAILPPGGVPVTKKEFLFVPFLGLAIYLMKYVFLDRGNREKATASLKKAGERMQKEQLSAMIAPEGTRSKTGELQPFKLGPFYLAMNAKANILPVVIHNTTEIWPRSQGHSNTGTVVVHVLPEVNTEHYTSETMREHAHEVRELFVQDLEKGAPPLETGAPI